MTDDGPVPGPDGTVGTQGIELAKRVLREQLLAARRARSADDLASARQAVAGHVTAMATRRGWRQVAAYEPLRTEPGSVELLDALTSLGIAVIVPVTLDNGELDWTSWHPPAGRLGTDAIAMVDAVLLPALAVARDGTRLGRGRGYYDRALAGRTTDTDLAALVFDDELHESKHLPADEWDVPVGWAVHPSGVTRLHRNTAVGPDL